ncbi:hypothetical protein BDV34DRAFT_219486 [Aspergillus parasiticus]|uniref:Glycosyltransferase family 1 protein n=1 Tax=Aspergillus parasiticus TaxID=5067 RepID=A0A5N6E515_ASPPA|nr:hypothetical protein BDV34DRAFT_219486 [Aspergillus parasiticus]
MSHPHWVLSCKPGWSHFRTLCVLAVRIVSFRPITVTIVISNRPGLVDQVTAEVRRCLHEQVDQEASCIKRISILAVPIDQSDPDGAFSSAWQALRDEVPIARRLKDNLLVAAPVPSLVILDGFQLSWMRIIRAQGDGKAPPILQWMMGFSAGFVRMCGPADLGGRGDALRSLELRDCLEATKPCGRLVHIPGLPPMYDWEFFPWDQGAKSEIILAAEAQEADGLLTNSSIAYDGKECLDGISEWVARRGGRKTFHLGPMMPFRPGATRFSQSVIDAELASMPNSDGVRSLQFLDQVLENYGPRSLVYISFGTEQWPESLDQIQALLDTLAQRRIPFLLTYVSPAAQLPAGAQAQFSDLGLFVRYGPQQAILGHQATGWFLTHGGMNGTMEALSQGVPLIGWPFSVDQPVNIARLTRVLDVGFELMEVRSGVNGLQPVQFRNHKPCGTTASLEKELSEVFDAMVGEEGNMRRANAEKVRDDMARSWLEGGSARNEFEKFLDFWMKA